METWIKIDELRPIVDSLNSEKITYGKAIELITKHCRSRVELSKLSQFDVNTSFESFLTYYEGIDDRDRDFYSIREHYNNWLKTKK